MGIKPGRGIIRWGLPTAGLILLLALITLAGQARAVPDGQSGSFASSASVSDPVLQPAGNGPMYAKLNIRIVTGQGSITWNPLGIKNFKPEDCPGAHSGTSTFECYFERGTTVTFTATPDSGYELHRWEGECSGTGTCHVTVDAEGYVMARFRVEGEGGKGDARKCERAKKILKRAQGMLNKAKKQTSKAKKQLRKARKQTRKAKKQAWKKAKAKQKNAQNALKRARARAKSAC